MSGVHTRNTPGGAQEGSLLAVAPDSSATRSLPNSRHYPVAAAAAAHLSAPL